MKKLILLFFLFCMLIILFVAFFVRPQQRTSVSVNSPTPTPISGPSVKFGQIDYSTIFPDTQTAAAITQTLQHPIEASQEAGFTVVSFPTDTKGRPDQVFTKDGKAEYITQEITTDNTDLSDFISSHPGSQSFTLYDTANAGSGFSWYVYPEDGMAFLANKNYGYAMRILYFPKMSQAEFMTTGAKQFNLQTTDPDAQDDATVTN